MKKVITPEEAVVLVEKRRLNARRYYARMRDDARRYREQRQVEAEHKRSDEQSKT